MGSPPPFRPMRVAPQRAAFDHPDWVFEPKLDGVRVLAHLSRGIWELRTADGRRLHRWPALPGALDAVEARDAVIDGEVACFGADGRTDFTALVFEREPPALAAFDLLWLDGEDWRPYPLLERKRRLADLLRGTAVRYVNHVRAFGVDLYRSACARDLEGIVGKWASARYETDEGTTSWVAIENPTYSQRRDGGERLDRAAGLHPRMARAELTTDTSSLGVPRRRAIVSGGT